ncbi:MAG: hypothetical protein ACFFA2_13110 [Promethearchaeota archaeon]
MNEQTLLKEKKKEQFYDSLENMWGKRSNGTKKLKIKLSSGTQILSLKLENSNDGKIKDTYNLISNILKDFFS